VAKAKQCFAHFHMTPEEYGLWYYCRCVSKLSSTVYLSGREIAKEFEGVSKNVIYRIGDSLTAKGWFRDLAPYHRNAKTGTLVPRTVYALTHEEWVAKYSDIGCRPPKPPVPKSGRDDSAPVPVSESPVPVAGHSCPDSRTDLSRNQEQRIKEVETKDKRKRERKANNPDSLDHPENGQGMDRTRALEFVREIVKAAQKVESSAVILPHHKKQLTDALLGTDFNLPELIRAAKTEAADWTNDPYRCGQAGNLLVSKLVNHALIAREDKEKELATQQMLAESTEREQAKAATELAEIEQARAAELALVEDTL
jgi:hypothetical protein